MFSKSKNHNKPNSRTGAVEATHGAAVHEPKPAGSEGLVSYEVCNPHPEQHKCKPSKKEKRKLRYQRRHEAQQRAYGSFAADREMLRASGMEAQADSMKLPRTFWCGHKAKPGTQFVEVRRDGENGHAHVSNIQYCGSVWQCPVCGAIIRNQRAQEITEAITKSQEQGMGAYFITCTVRHHKGDDLKTLLRVLSNAYRDMVNGSQYRKAKEAHGLVGYIKSLEITVGENGFHPHNHVLMFTEGKATEDGAAQLQSFLLERWKRFVVKHGGEEPNEHGLMVVPVDKNAKVLGQYLAKMAGEDGIALEMARADLKRGGDAGSLTPFELLDIDTPRARALWAEYCEATKGKRSVYFSRGLRDRLGMGKEKTDEEIAQELEKVGSLEVVIDADSYEAAIDRDYAAVPTILELVEEKKFEDLSRYLNCELSETVMPDRMTGELVKCRVLNRVRK